MRVHVWSDGFSASDGRAGWAYLARDAEDGALASEAGALSDAPSHLVEWIAVSRALAWADATLSEGDTLELRVDSALVAKGLSSRRPEMSGEAAVLRAACRQALARLAQRGVRSSVVRIRREENEEADALARGAAGGPTA